MASGAALDYQEDEYLFDFLYVDRARLASYAGQLFNDGHLAATKKTKSIVSGVSGAMEGGFPGIVKGQMTGHDSATEAIEQQFDTAWAATLNVLRELNEQGFVAPEVSGALLGQIFIFKGRIQVLDYRVLQKLYRPLVAHERLVGQRAGVTHAQKQRLKVEEKTATFAIEAIEQLPHLLQMRAFGNSGQVWGTLDPACMTANPADLAFKYGPSIPGDWAILALLDAKPYDPNEELQLPTGISDLEFAMLQMAMQLKLIFGRSPLDYGITPLAIYRKVMANGQ